MSVCVCEGVTVCVGQGECVRVRGGEATKQWWMIPDEYSRRGSARRTKGRMRMMMIHDVRGRTDPIYRSVGGGSLPTGLQRGQITGVVDRRPAKPRAELGP